jgi:hypothetical protein
MKHWLPKFHATGADALNDSPQDGIGLFQVIDRFAHTKI